LDNPDEITGISEININSVWENISHNVH